MLGRENFKNLDCTADLFGLLNALLLGRHVLPHCSRSSPFKELIEWIGRTLSTGFFTVIYCKFPPGKNKEKKKSRFPIETVSFLFLDRKPVPSRAIFKKLFQKKKKKSSTSI